MRRFRVELVIVAALTVWAVLASCNAVLGELNQDEGWYLYAAHLTAHGKLPFRDYAFTQGPVFPLVYRFAEPLVRRWGLLGGRGLTALLGLAAALLAALLAGRLAGRGPAGRYAALLCLVLVTVNVYQSYFTTVVKTYSLAALLLAGALLLLAVEARPFASSFAAGALLCLGAATRSSAGVAVPVPADLPPAGSRVPYGRIHPGGDLRGGAGSAAVSAE